ncbi:MFS transporter [Nocardioides sp. TRM66260-LWL]|uniref:MFS transporter n=1 Tax=Nocardioides sp. TRM66260-LWL TaxID=2874478 RepID=UPI001CC75474|nr:MFS transporter [Nocardioides sp. TRM66260-LWL]MBZ5736282.1 MFS transporter [Nocardioides sp. TRM66260-LWL]
MSAAEDWRGSRTAWTVWGVALAMYTLAVFHRSSLAVAGLAAAERFDISASQLASFTMLQLAVYAGLQIPVGLAVDRFGPRLVALTGAAVIAVGEATFALAASYPVALGARFLVGAGDAMTFICVIRLLSSWFPRRRIPFMTQVTGTVGQLGSIGAAIPMTWALGTLGWTRAYLVTAVLSLAVAALGLLVLRDGPTSRSVRGETLSLPAMRASLAASWAQPGTRLGFWVHFCTPFSANVLALLWGYPFLVRGEGRSDAEAGVLLTVMTVAVVLAGPVLGGLISRHPWHRSTMVLAIVGAMAAAWTLVLAWPGQAPLPVLVLLVVVAGVGGPASVIGFDLARTSNPGSRLASATGIVNVAGFVATLVLVVAIGVVLDALTPGGGSDYPVSAFRWAMSLQYLLWGLGAIQIVRYRRATRAVTDRDALRAGVPVPE